MAERLGGAAFLIHAPLFADSVAEKRHADGHEVGNRRARPRPQGAVSRCSASAPSCRGIPATTTCTRFPRRSRRDRTGGRGGRVSGAPHRSRRPALRLRAQLAARRPRAPRNSAAIPFTHRRGAGPNKVAPICAALQGGYVEALVARRGHRRRRPRDDRRMNRGCQHSNADARDRDARASRPRPSASAPGRSAAGCGAAPTRRKSIAAIQAVDRRGRHADRHRARLRHGSVGGDRRQGARGAARRGRARDQMRPGLAHAEGQPFLRPGRQAGAPLSGTGIDRPRGRAEPEAARHRPHRPLHHPLAGPDDADRRDDGGARGPEARRARSARSAPATSSPADVEAYVAAGRLDAIQEEYSMVNRDIEADAPAALRSNTASRCSATRRWRSGS